MQNLLVFSASILLCVLTSTAATNRAALVTVKSDGTIAPTGAVASITQLANNVAKKPKGKK